MPNGIPCSDTFRRVFARLDSSELLRCLQEWLACVHQCSSGGGLVNIDGKSIRGSADSKQVHSACVNTACKNVFPRKISKA
ncbi:MAG: hypothetical protein LBU67_06795 [Oscillospiraceae bacterium]|nr:hypothetical protein [Oscillospiraceae bacterium]